MPELRRSGSTQHPDVGDGDWVDRRECQQSLQLDAWLQSCRRPVVIELGAGTAIASVRVFSQQVIRHANGRLVRIIPREADVPSTRDVVLATGALTGLRLIERCLQEP